MSFSEERLLHAVQECLARAASAGQPSSGLCVALSGGLDSSVLVAGLARLGQSGGLPPLRAIHVDHGLHPDSALWAEGCQRLAARLRVPLHSVRVDAHAAAGESPEAAARSARYGALAQHLGAAEVLCTAHHADDQLETILLQWLRGGGLRAVAGMPRLARFGPGWHARPLLGFTRGSLEAWGRAAGLEWLEDPSNRDTRYDRNYLRLEVLPALRRRWPAAAHTIGRVAEYATEALELEASIASADLLDVTEGTTVVLGRLQALPEARQKAVLRAWLRSLGLPVPASRTLAALRHDMTHAAADRVPRAEWPGAVVRRYRGRLYAVAADAGPIQTGTWNVGQSRRFALGGNASLELVPDVGVGLSQAKMPDVVDVAVQVGGERFHPAGGAHRRPLRKWLQERGVLPWQRESIPVLRSGETLLAIADISCAASHAATAGEPSWRIEWNGRPALTETEACRLRWREDPAFD